MKGFINGVCVAVVLSLCACDTNHSDEFYRIDRDDIVGYEKFIKKYPNSNLVDDAKERIEVAKENLRIAQEQRLQEELLRLKEDERIKLEEKYGNNSLSNGSQPYSEWYGFNKKISDYTPHSEIQVTASSNSDVIVIVRYDNHNGNVAAHKYIQAGKSATLYLKNGYKYQTFFYYGTGWYPEKEMSNGVKGGFIANEAFSKDEIPVYMDNNVLTYELISQINGNFQTSVSSEGEMF